MHIAEKVQMGFTRPTRARARARRESLRQARGCRQSPSVCMERWCGICVYSVWDWFPHHSNQHCRCGRWWEVGRWRGFDFMLVMPDPEQTFTYTRMRRWVLKRNDGPERRVKEDAPMLDTAP